MKIGRPLENAFAAPSIQGSPPRQAPLFLLQSWPPRPGGLPSGGRQAATDGTRKGEPNISNKVFVGNLSFDVTRDELIQAFSAAGKVVDAKVPTDRETGRPRGFAFVEFEDDDSAQKSIALLNGKDLKGRPMRVNEAENRPPRPPGAGPFRPAFRSPSSFGEAREFPDFGPTDDRGRPFKTKGSRRNIRRRKRGFD
jgi:RNA recognition motif-containing protein